MNARRTSKRISTLNQEQIAYINGCNTLQRAVWRITHKDPLSAFGSQIRRFLLREAILILIAIRERNNKAILKLALLKWLRQAKTISQNKERLRVLLKIIFLNYESAQKTTISKYLLRWAAKTSKSDAEILKKYGHLFQFLDLLVKNSLIPAKKHFLNNLKKTTNPEYFKKPLTNCLRSVNKRELNLLKKAFNTWRLNARKEALNELKKIVLRNMIVSTLRSREKQILQKALRKWHNNAIANRLIDDFNDVDFINQMRTMILIYGKYNRINRLNRLARAFAKWRLNTIERGEPLSSKILRAKKHMLKHNINKNAEDLLNALRDVAEIKRLELLLRKFILRAPKYNLPLLRRAFRRWYDNANALKNKDSLRNIQLRYATDLANRTNKDQMKEILRKAFQTWRRNASGPKTALPDTEKAINYLRKATVQPFFQKMRENILKDMNSEKFRALIAAYFRKNDKDLLHWWFGQWRKNALRLKVYELKALLLKHLADSKERNEKLKAIRELKDKIDNYRFKDVLKTTVLRSLLNKITKLNDEVNKGKLARALYLWRSKLDHPKKKDLLDNYDEGTKILRRFCWRTTHPDVLDAFDFKITFPAQDQLLRKIINSTDRNNLRDKLLKALYRWRMNCVKPEEDKVQKLKDLFERYLGTEPIRKKLMAPYKDIIRAMKKARETKEDAAKKIADYLRGIKEIPDQVRNLKISKYLMKLLGLRSENDYLTLKSAFNEWIRRARNIKADEDARIIQKFVRDKLAKRFKRKARFEEAIEHTRNYILMRIFDKIADHADRNRIPDILLKYYLRKNANDMKLLRDKFNHWRNLLPKMRLDDAASRIQANLRGYLLRKDFNRFNRITEILFKLVEKMLEKEDVVPAFQKWRKNARLLKCDEDARIIQQYCRKKLDKRLMGKAQERLQRLFKDYIFKLIAKMLSTKTIKPDDINKLCQTLKRVACREPFEKLMKGLRWKMIINQLKNIPKIYDRSREALLRKYLERWYINAIEIPDEMANKIQNAYRGYLANRKLGKLKRLHYILEQLLLKYITSDEDKKYATLMKWNKNARLLKCDEDARIIQRFCRKIHDKVLASTIEKWKNLAKKIMPKRINSTAKFNNINVLINKLIKKKFFDNLIDTANRKNLYEMMEYLLSKYDKNALRNLLRRRLREWLDKAKKLRDRDNDAATYIQTLYRGYLTRKNLDRTTRIQEILEKLILKTLYYSDEIIPATLHKWNKNARLLKCDEDARIIQKFCRKTLDKIKKLKDDEYLNRINNGLDKLENLRLNIRYAWNKILDDNKRKALEDLVKKLQDKITNRRRETFEDIYEYGIDKLLRRLFPLREKLLKELLRKKLRQWKDKADKLGKLRAAEMIQRNYLRHVLEKIRNKLLELLFRIVRRRNESEIDKLRRILKKWRDNAKKLGKDAAGRRITKYLTDRYLLSNARKNWKDLADKLKRKTYGDSIWELQKKLKEYITLKDVIDSLNNKIKKDGLDQLKRGDTWLTILEILRKLFGNQDDRNNDKLKRKYLRRWLDKVKRLKDRDDKLVNALDEIQKRQLINDVNTFTDITLAKRVTDSIPVARAYDFFDRLRNLEKYRKNLLDLKNNLLSKLVRKTNKRSVDILRNILRQWNDTAQKMKEDAAKNRIARWTEERYRIANARKNWRKLADLYDLYRKNGPLYDLRKRLIEYMTLKQLAKNLKNKIRKDGLDQLKDGIDFLNLLKFLKTLFENWDERNRLVLLRHYLRKWNDKARKLKNRDKKTKKAMDEIEKRQLINDVDTIANACLCKKLTDSIPVARTYDFFDKLRDLANRRNKMYGLRTELLTRLIDKLSRYSMDNLRRKLRQWNDTARKMKEEAAKNRIARWTEERYRIANARKNWRKLADLYDLYCNKRPLYDIRKRLIEYMTLKGLTDKLRNKFAKNGNDQFRKGIDYLTLLKYLKKLFGDVDEINRLLLLKYYLNKWNDKAIKLKRRDNKLRKAMNEIEKRQLINDVNTIADVEVTKRFKDAIPIARAYEFFKTIRDLERRRIDLSNYKKNLLRKLVNYLSRYSDDILRNKLKQWNNIAQQMKEDAAKNRIARWTEERYRIANARKNWRKLADLYDLYTQKRPLYELRNRLIKFMTLKDLADKLRNRFTKTGNDQFKEGIDYALLLKYLKKLFGDVDEINRLLLLKYYLNKWNNKAKKLKRREDKLRKAMNEIERRQLINDVDTIADVEISKRVTDAVPVARAYDFFKTLRELEKRRIHLSNYKNNLIRKLVNHLSRYSDDILRNKLRQWNNIAQQMKEDAAKNRIARWTEERYRIANARKNWRKLADLYDLYTQKRPLFELRNRLIKFMTLKDLADKLRNRFTKTGNDQFKEGVDYALLLKYLKKLFGDVDDVNRLLLLKYYINKWNNKAKKLKRREDKLRKAMNELERRQLINDVDTVADVEQTKRITDAIPVARAYDFFDKLRDLSNRYNKLYGLRTDLLIKILDRLSKYTDDYLRNKLRIWLLTANRLKEESAKNRIARWTEERYRIANARKNWRKLADLYDLYTQKRPLFDLRQRLIKFMTLKDLADKLRNRFTKTGNDQFKEGVKHILLLKYLKKLFGDVDEVNRLLLLKYYLNKWNNKAKKLKLREDLLRDAFDTINLKNLIDATNTVKDASIVKKVDSAVPVARSYDFFDRIRRISDYNTKYNRLGEDLVKAKDDLDAFNKYTLLRKLYKVYYYKVLDNMLNNLDKLNDRYKNYFADYFLKLLQYILLSKRSDRYNKQGTGEKEPLTKRLLFKGKTDKKIKVPQDRSVLTMLLPSLIKFLNDKFLNHKKWAWDKLVDNDRALKFCKLYRTFADKTILQPKRDLVDLLKAEHAYMNGLGAANCDLFKLLRRYWIKLVCDSMLAPSRIYKILYLIKMVMMHKTIAYQRFIRELVRKWRFSAFIQSISRRKLELMYKNLHVSYLQMANELFGEKGSKNASVVKEFERLATRMGIFTNEDYNSVNEENFCEKITKKYVFQPMPLLLEKEGPTQFFASGIEIEDSGENNEDYYVDQELGGETIGKYKQETNKSNSKADKNSSRLSKY